MADHGVSGTYVPLAQRPEGRRLFDMLRKGDVLVLRWVDRLGRNYQDVSNTLGGEGSRHGIDRRRVGVLSR